MSDNYKLNGNISLIYKVDKEFIDNLENSLDKSPKSAITINKLIQNKIDIKYFNFKETKGNYRLNRIYTAKLFKEKQDNFVEFYIFFSIEIHDLNSDEKKELKNLIFDKEIIKEVVPNIKLLNNISSIYYRLIKTSDLSEQDIKNILNLNKSDILKDFKGMENNDHIQYINHRYNVALEKGKEDSKRNFDRVHHFLLAVAYKNYYEDLNIQISNKALESDSYEDLLSFSENTIKFDTINFFENPTKREHYKYFYDKLKINDTRSSFLSSLDNLNKYTKIKHEQEQLDQDRQKQDKDNKRNLLYTFLGLIIALASFIEAIL
jgi:hypothetical protein